MAKILFIPFSVIGGMIAGLISKKLLDFVWRRIDNEEPPEAGQPYAPMWKLVLSMALEGAVFQTTRGLTDHGSRMAFRRLTGVWPGETPETQEA